MVYLGNCTRNWYNLDDFNVRYYIRVYGNRRISIDTNKYREYFHEVSKFDLAKIISILI